MRWEECKKPILTHLLAHSSLVSAESYRRSYRKSKIAIADPREASSNYPLRFGTFAGNRHTAGNAEQKLQQPLSWNSENRIFQCGQSRRERQPLRPMRLSVPGGNEPYVLIYPAR